MPDESRTPPNRLLVPLIVLCVVCAGQAVIIGFLLGRTGRSAAAAPAVQAGANSPVPLAPTPVGQSLPPAGGTAAAASAPPKLAEASPGTPAIVRGKVRQRVEAGGLAVTVLDVSDQPRINILTPPGGAKFADCDVLLENTGPKAMRYYAALIKLQDDQARVFDGDSIAGGGPLLGYGTVVPGAKVRGHIAFDLPKDAKGLTLVCPVNSASEQHSIEIDLGR